MKSTTTSKLFATSFALTLLATLNPQLSTFAQGSLTPPGPPAPTMKTLAQIEPRTPIGIDTTPGDADSLFKITQPGSYYLTSNITGIVAKSGIEVAVWGVTLDLMGFELVGVPASMNGVRVTASATNVVVRNGTVRNWGADGVEANNARNAHYQDLRLSANGSVGLVCGGNSAVVNCHAERNGSEGIRSGDNCAISGCTARFNANTGNNAGISAGIGCTVSGCAADSNGNRGIVARHGSTISGCTASKNTLDGIYAEAGSTISDCTAYSGAGDGIVAGGAGTIKGCTVYLNGNDGIEVGDDCRVVDNSCDSNGGNLFGGGAGIYVTGNANRIDSNNVTNNRRGIDVGSTVNLIIRNSARGNTSGNYVIVSGNRVGTIVVPPLSGAIAGNGPGAGSGATDPFANFAY